MDIMKWIARKGAVGGTARWAANGYKTITKQSPEIGLVVFQVIIVGYNRFSLILASFVVNCQSTFLTFSFRIRYQAST